MLQLYDFLSHLVQDHVFISWSSCVLGNPHHEQDPEVPSTKGRNLVFLLCTNILIPSSKPPVGYLRNKYFQQTDGAGNRGKQLTPPLILFLKNILLLLVYLRDFAIEKLLFHFTE